MKRGLEKRIQALEPVGHCPHRQRLMAMTEEELDAKLANLMEIITEHEEWEKHEAQS